jgi:hypothetical protein
VLKGWLCNEKKISTLLTLVIFLSLVLNAPNYAKAFTPVNVQGSIEATFNPNDSSNNLSDAKDFNDSQVNASVDEAHILFILDHHAPLANDIYEIRYTVSSTTLVSGTQGRLVLKNANLLDSTIYYDKQIYKIFPTSLFYTGTLDYVYIPPDVSLIDGNYSSCLMYFNDYERWVSGKTLSGRIEILR